MRKLIFITLSLLLLSLVNAAEFPATFSFTTSPMIVYDVPFLVNLNVETAGQSYIDYDLTVQGTNNIFTFATGLNRRDDFTFNSDLSKANGAFYRVRVDTNGKLLGAGKVFTLSKVKLSGVDSTDSLSLGGSNNKLTHPTAGNSYTITTTPLQVSGALSICGDGVVGYIDDNANGVKDTGETNEACDTHYWANGVLTPNPTEACAASCTYIDADHKISGGNCGFGSYNCQLLKKDPKEILLQKFEALIYGKCYPLGSTTGDCSHPSAYNSKSQGNTFVPNSKSLSLESSDKINVIRAISTLLVNYFIEPGIVSPPPNLPLEPLELGDSCNPDVVCGTGLVCGSDSGVCE
jgi:hypothetical protein